MHIQWRMSIAPEVTAFDSEVKAAGVHVADVLRRAGVAHTTWSRWTGGQFEPRAATLRKLRQALAEELKNRQAA